MADEPQPSEEPTAAGVGLFPPDPEPKAPLQRLVLPVSSVEPEDAGYGLPGRPVNRRHPFFIGLSGALGVALAYGIVLALGHAAGVLLLIGTALFLAVGLNPAVEWLIAHGRSRGLAVSVICVAFVVVLGGFFAAAIPPTLHEAHLLTTNYPHYRQELIAGKGWIGRLAVQTHLSSYLAAHKTLHFSLSGGVLGAHNILSVGKTVASVAFGVSTVVVLTVYFLIALPAVRGLWLRLMPRSRRERVTLLTDETFRRIGGFLLGNLLTSLVTGVGTFVWLTVFNVPYAMLLALFVALVDLVPIIGSTIGGVVVSLVALARGVPIAVATLCFYIVYRFFEDYLLTPRVMRHTVRVSPGVTIIATLVGGTLIGLIGALIAIPVAATIQLLLEEVALPRFERL